MTLPDFVNSFEQEMEKREFGDGELSVYSDPADVVGFQWKLEVYAIGDSFTVNLFAYPPDCYTDESFVKFVVNL